MPSFNFPPTMAHQLPPTPPEYKPFPQPHRSQGGQSLYPGHAFPPRHEVSGYEFIDQYAQRMYGNQAAYPSQHPPSMQTSHYSNGEAAMNQSHTNFRSARAPILPPIMPQDHMVMDSAVPPEYRPAETHIHHEHPAKEEKATGGVAAHLDYEMDQMSEFVSEMAQGIVHPGTTVSSNLRKYVLQILSSTRLPSSTILFALFLLAQRYRQLANTFHAHQPGMVYRMLITSLLLGSKFLDDNTFQNRSWSEVSNIPVLELNKMEMEWLQAIEWHLHRDPKETEGFNAFLSHWNEWKRNRARVAEPQKLAPIDTTLRRHPSVTKQLFSPEGPIPHEYHPAHFDNWHHGQTSECSPPSAPHTGPTTPDYYASGMWAYANPTPAPPYPRSFQIHHALPLSSQPSYHHTPYTQTQPYAYSGWTGHGSSCGCSGCLPHADPYFVDRAYRVQPLAG